ncbi:hypothetical protein ElyMa_004521600 [Elysia marginata]|uniref:Uncharacterized protein n=1 Tax=Elysia marginata TaxID=1093978 RepID=A0AAV4HR66_9GAST|nr:hypothetical protein ElyMa_004521600 [Elysia marginata]
MSAINKLNKQREKSSLRAPVSTDGVERGSNFQNASSPQPAISRQSVTTAQQKTAIPDSVNSPAPEAKALPSETFVKTVLRGFFEDLKKRPRLVDDILRHETYKELLSEPMTVVETIQLNSENDGQQSKEQPQVRPLVAPVLTLVPVLLNPGRDLEENPGQDIVIPTQEPIFVSGLGNPKSSLNNPESIAGVKQYAHQSGQHQNKYQKPQETTNAKSFKTRSQSQPQLTLKALGIPQELQHSEIEVNPGDGGKTAVFDNQKEEPRYIYSIAEPGPQSDSQETEVGSSSTAGDCDGSNDADTDALVDEGVSEVIYDEAPAYYYYIYYDEDGAPEAEKKLPPLQDYPLSTLPAMEGKIYVPSQPQRADLSGRVAAADYPSTQVRHQPSSRVDQDQKEMSSRTEEGMSKTDVGSRDGTEQNIEKAETASVVEDDDFQTQTTPTRDGYGE